MRGFARGGVEKGIPGRRNSLWFCGPSGSQAVSESEEETLEDSKKARAPLQAGVGLWEPM